MLGDCCQNPVLFSFLTYHRIVNKSNTTRDIIEVETALPSEAH